MRTSWDNDLKNWISYYQGVDEDKWKIIKYNWIIFISLEKKVTWNVTGVLHIKKVLLVIVLSHTKYIQLIIAGYFQIESMKKCQSL